MLAHGSDAFRAKNLVNPAPLFEDSNSLQIWPESPVRRMLGEAAIMTEGCCFTAFCALCHV